MSPAKRPHSRDSSSKGAQQSEAPARAENLSREEAGRSAVGTFFGPAGWTERRGIYAPKDMQEWFPRAQNSPRTEANGYRTKRSPRWDNLKPCGLMAKNKSSSSFNSGGT